MKKQSSLELPVAWQGWTRRLRYFPEKVEFSLAMRIIILLFNLKSLIVHKERMKMRCV